MRPTNGITSPASLVVTVSHAGTEIQPTVPAENHILTVHEGAELLKCKKSPVYNLRLSRGQARCDNPIPVSRLPMGLRFRRSSVLAWLAMAEGVRLDYRHFLQVAMKSRHTDNSLCLCWLQAHFQLWVRCLS
jgi:hypothetical protein